jgi:hypothetical protein
MKGIQDPVIEVFLMQKKGDLVNGFNILCGNDILHSYIAKKGYLRLDLVA